jgi:hypothetical protein
MIVRSPEASFVTYTPKAGGGGGACSTGLAGVADVVPAAG